jgi:CRP-like cAMP-binding protein
MDARDVIAANPFFAEVLDDPDIDRLARWAHSVEKTPGEDLIVEDDAGTSLFIIVSGEVEVLTGDGRRSKRIARLGPGSVVGEMSLMTGARRSATVRAITALRALEVSDAALAPIVEASPDLVDRFAAVLKKRQAELDRAYGAGAFSMLDARGFASLIRSFFGRNI